jgi:hypothetical protein
MSLLGRRSLRAWLLEERATALTLRSVTKWSRAFRFEVTVAAAARCFWYARDLDLLKDRDDY